jgi:multidrug transporter EmrE-like cation transporter
MNLGYLYVATTIAFTVYGQLIVKWQVNDAGDFPDGAGDKIHFLFHLLLRPWVLSALAGGGIAAVAWMAALTRFELSRAYPWMSLSFVIVLLASALLFSEGLSVPKVTGILLIFVGLAVGSQ